MNGHLEGFPQPYLRDLATMVINHLLTGMILQVCLSIGGLLHVVICRTGEVDSDIGELTCAASSHGPLPRFPHP